MDNWNHQYIQVNGIRLHYVTEGEGKLVVLLHGFPQFWYAWRHQVSALSKKFKVVVPDLRGYGQSDKPQKIEDYQTNLIASDIAALVLALGYDKAHVAGHDWGGGIAWQLALNQPQLIDHLAILNCPHPKAFAKALKSNYKQMLRSWYIYFFQLPYVPEWLLKTFGRSILKDIMKEGSIRKDTFSEEDLEQYLKAFQQPGVIHAALNYYRAAFRKSIKNKKTEIKQITSPTLIIWGENDEALGKELTFHMEPYFKSSFHIEYIQNCSHWVMEEQPEKVNELLIKHFS